MSRKKRVPRELKPEDLGPSIDLSGLPFDTTADVEPRRSPLGQERALRSIRLGVRMQAPGYNVFVVGLTGSRKESLLKELVAADAPDDLEPPSDWVYVFNFKDPDRPRAIRLQAGQGRRLRQDMVQFLEALKRQVPEAFRQETFEHDKEALSKKYEEQIRELKQQFDESANAKNLHVQPTPQNQLLFIPKVDGEPIEDASQFEALSEDEKKRFSEEQENLGREAREMFKKQKALMEEMGREVEQIVKLYASRIIDPLIEATRAGYENPRIGEYLAALRDHTLENLEKFKGGGEQQQAQPFPLAMLKASEADRFLEYRINLVVDNADTGTVPILAEESPTYRNLFGAVEKVVDETGKLVTNFTRIKSGKILQASGGYLVFNLEDAITEPLVWKSLKRVLRSGLVSIESYEPFGFLAVAGLVPEPIPVNIRIVVHGSALLLRMLQYWDPDFSESFKIVAHFDYETERDGDGVTAYAERIAHITHTDSLPPFDRGAVAEMVLYGARRVGHQDKISALLEDLDDLVREAAFFALEDESAAVGSKHVRQALEDRRYRWGRTEEKLRELIREGTLLVDVDGAKVGQVNGLAVLNLGEYAFGRPSRVTASLGMGAAGIVNIEREARMSGSTHDKGMLILAGYLRGRYGRNRPLAFSASIAFEQSYSGIDGDSASSTELYALLSSLANLPLRQDLAVTGSVNQLGEIQAIGGVNEKVEGFYRVCKAVGLSGTQGVMIPAANVRHLILHPEVVEAVRDGRFHVYPVSTVDQGMEILTGLPSGKPGQEGTVEGAVDAALEGLDRQLQERSDSNLEKVVEKRDGGGGEQPPPKPPEPSNALPGNRP